ncbi:MAG: lasso peptide biosynthesis B2 protein, partial [Polaromonas sp.]|nr:lasso peptide biosynthesis B2 protein [Gemmatimonadaceae bacterium]
LIGEEAVDAATKDIYASATSNGWIKPLLRQNLLTNEPITASRGRPQAVGEALSSLNMEDANDAGVGWRDLARLWRSTLVASSWIRRLSLDEIADRIATLRRRNSGESGPRFANAVLHAVATYERLRPLALTSHDRCLYDSLTLIHFLAMRGLFPTWVIGVRIHPFSAHSWVQSGSVVLNDLAERVRHYQPVLVV